ncbi:MAG: hypothetical protein U1E73_01525 [Planctomycetota bacterium]
MVAPTDSWVPGYRFKDGRLLIFERERITLVDVWPEPAAAVKDGDAAWRPIHPEFRLVRPYRPRRPKTTAPAATRPKQLLLPMAMPPAPAKAPTRGELAEQKRRAFDALRFALPRDLARAIEGFPCCQFALIRVFAAMAEFLDLLASNPLLAFALGQRLGAHATATPEHRIVLAKQPELAGHLGFPATPAAARTLRKVFAESVTPAAIPALRRVLRDDDATRRMAHLRRINAGVIALLGDERLRAAAAPALLDEVAQAPLEKYRAEVADLLVDVLTLEQELRGPGRLPTFASIEAVRAAHHRVGVEYAEKKASGLLDCRFPRPPLRGNADIVALTSPQDLAVEGVQQRNCVASYAPAVARGDTFVYRVLAPERATLALRRSPAGHWYRSELRASCNRPVSPSTSLVVDAWLDEHTVSA